MLCPLEVQLLETVALGVTDSREILEHLGCARVPGLGSGQGYLSLGTLLSGLEHFPVVHRYEVIGPLEPCPKKELVLAIACMRMGCCTINPSYMAGSFYLFPF